MARLRKSMLGIFLKFDGIFVLVVGMKRPLGDEEVVVLILHGWTPWIWPRACTSSYPHVNVSIRFSPSSFSHLQLLQEVVHNSLALPAMLECRVSPTIHLVGCRLVSSISDLLAYSMSRRPRLC